MDRRTFLKRAGGLTLGLTALQLGLPHKAKTQIASPITRAVGGLYLDETVRRNIASFKKNHPNLKIGETHCHSTFSDGHYAVPPIMHRAATLGLDFLVITEHLIPGRYPLENTLASMRARWNTRLRWVDPATEPIQVYPAFEVSTRQGHLILLFPENWLDPKNAAAFEASFSILDRRFLTMEAAARLGQKLDGVSIIPHPNIDRPPYPFGAEVGFVRQNLVGLVDGIEDISTGHGYQADYARELDMASIGSSDDHFNFIVGTTVTAYDADRYSDLPAAIRARDTRPVKIDDSLDDFIAAARTVL